MSFSSGGGSGLRRAAVFAADDSGSDGEEKHASSSKHHHRHHHHHHHRHRHHEHRNGSSSNRDGEAITGFSSSGAELAQKHLPPKEPIVIPVLPDVDFRAIAHQRRRGRDLASELGSLNSMRRDGNGPVVPRSDSELHRTGASGAANGSNVHGQATRDRIGDEEQHKGLVVRTAAGSQKAGSSAPGFRSPTPPSADVRGATTPPPESADEAARRALLAGARGAGAGCGVNDSLTIPMVVDEEQALRDDVDDRPDAPSLETYTAIPVEGFGAAMLRGMGWKEGMGAGRKRDGPTEAMQVKKRPQLLGLGAKERQQVADQRGATTSGSRRKDAPGSSRPTARGYMPLVRREAGSGDVIASASASRSGTPVQSDGDRRPDYSRRRHEDDGDRGGSGSGYKTSGSGDGRYRYRSRSASPTPPRSPAEAGSRLRRTHEQPSERYRRGNEYKHSRRHQEPSFRDEYYRDKDRQGNYHHHPTSRSRAAGR
ncbi:hypothetical protein K437DRAFT_252903 [Tilletiaria anomala UBC 951]|uniref:G-patch domain-containing protein n=1 Tax=Tilletiaria anomala (strain ATCC 24038 / CBS 436.72 / UBC 951) TaxID=1037660 RepID=A0A066WI78_TILAU|nr:uncharacterized protein K437DRAFT_252903 [Tilletiaria anomala UBC 951]KDN53541.1 hypothetical protein K437DRAFT_252903 [Tilletiaria anomala UBC 951]